MNLKRIKREKESEREEEREVDRFRDLVMTYVSVL